MICPDCHRTTPDDEACVWCATADRALAPVVPIAPRLARERPEKPQTGKPPQAVPEGLREARRVLAQVTEAKKRSPHPQEDK